MLVGQAVVFNAIPIKGVFGKLRHLCPELVVGGIRRKEALVLHIAPELFVTRLGGTAQALLNGIHGAVQKAISAHAPGIEHGEGCHSLDALVGLRRRQRVAAAPADTQRTDAPGVHHGKQRQIIHHAADVLDAVCGIVPQPRLAVALALVAGIASQRNEARFRQPLGIQPGHLLLAAAVGMGNGHGGILHVAGFIAVRRQIQIRGDPDPLHLISHAADLHPAGKVLSNGVLIHQSKGIVHFASSSSGQTSSIIGKVLQALGQPQ